MQKNMIIGIIQGLYPDNRKENGSYSIMMATSQCWQDGCVHAYVLLPLLIQYSMSLFQTCTDSRLFEFICTLEHANIKNASAT